MLDDDIPTDHHERHEAANGGGETNPARGALDPCQQSGPGAVTLLVPVLVAIAAQALIAFIEKLAQEPLAANDPAADDAYRAVQA